MKKLPNELIDYIFKIKTYEFDKAKEYLEKNLKLYIPEITVINLNFYESFDIYCNIIIDLGFYEYASNVVINKKTGHIIKYYSECCGDNKNVLIMREEGLNLYEINRLFTTREFIYYFDGVSKTNIQSPRFF